GTVARPPRPVRRGHAGRLLLRSRRCHGPAGTSRRERVADALGPDPVRVAPLGRPLRDRDVLGRPSAAVRMARPGRAGDGGDAACVRPRQPAGARPVRFETAALARTGQLRRISVALPADAVARRGARVRLDRRLSVALDAAGRAGRRLRARVALVPVRRTAVPALGRPPRRPSPGDDGNDFPPRWRGRLGHAGRRAAAVTCGGAIAYSTSISMPPTNPATRL